MLANLVGKLLLDKAKLFSGKPKSLARCEIVTFHTSPLDQSATLSDILNIAPTLGPNPEKPSPCQPSTSRPEAASSLPGAQGYGRPEAPSS